MARGAWRAIVNGVAKELDTTKQQHDFWVLSWLGLEVRWGIFRNYTNKGPQELGYLLLMHGSCGVRGGYGLSVFFCHVWNSCGVVIFLLQYLTILTCDVCFPHDIYRKYMNHLLVVFFFSLSFSVPHNFQWCVSKCLIISSLRKSAQVCSISPA